MTHEERLARIRHGMTLYEVDSLERQDLMLAELRKIATPVRSEPNSRVFHPIGAPRPIKVPIVSPAEPIEIPGADTTLSFVESAVHRTDQSLEALSHAHARRQQAVTETLTELRACLGRCPPELGPVVSAIELLARALESSL